MTAAGLTAYNFDAQHLIPAFIRCYKITASDWIDTTLLNPAYKGFFPVVGWHVSATTNTVATDITFGAVTINNAGTAYTATDTSIAVDTIAPYLVGPRTPPYYIMFGTAAGFEIMEVTADSLPTAAASTLTVKRGCLGTTPAAAYVANDIVGCMLNILVMTDTEIGNTIIFGYPLPNESKARIFELA
jgi:hypothetical protein